MQDQYHVIPNNNKDLYIAHVFWKEDGSSPDELYLDPIIAFAMRPYIAPPGVELPSDIGLDGPFTITLDQGFNRREGGISDVIYDAKRDVWFEQDGENGEGKESLLEYLASERKPQNVRSNRKVIEWPVKK